jgi:hypothetical protein
MSKYNKQYYINRSEKDSWGKHYEDDKYYDDKDLYDSFICFVHYSFAYLNLPAPSRAQIELADFVSDSSNPHRMLQCLRGLSKSLMAELYTVWRLLNDPDEHILVMSSTGGRAVNFTQFVQKLLTLLPVCNGMQPRHNKERTSGQSFDIAGAAPSDSPSVYAVGIGNQITGMRATLVIYDDIETPQNAQSANSRDKIDYYASEGANLLMAGRDETITLCTPHSMDSIYIDWINEKGFKPLIIPAEYPEDISIYNGYLAPYILKRLENNPELVGSNVDERFTLAVLANKKMKIGKSQYKLQYQLDVSASDELKHPLKLSDFIVMDVDNDDAPVKISPSSMHENRVLIKHNGFNTDKLYAPSFMSEQRVDYNYRVMAIDPSGRGADETGGALGFTLGGRIFLKKSVGFKGGYEYETLRQIAQMCSDYRIDYLVIEDNFGDGAYGKMMEPILNKISPNTKLEEVHAIGRKEVRIIRTLEPVLNQRKLVVDKKLLDDDTLGNVVNSLTYQLTRITEEPKSLRHDDRLDALEMLVTFVLGLENFDEDALSNRLEDEKLEEDLAEYMRMFELPYGGNMNYGSKY